MTTLFLSSTSDTHTLIVPQNAITLDNADLCEHLLTLSTLAHSKLWDEETESNVLYESDTHNKFDIYDNFAETEDGWEICLMVNCEKNGIQTLVSGVQITKSECLNKIAKLCEIIRDDVSLVIDYKRLVIACENIAIILYPELENIDQVKSNEIAEKLGKSITFLF